MSDFLKHESMRNQAIVAIAYSVIVTLIISYLPVNDIAGMVILSFGLAILTTIGFHNRAVLAPLVVAYFLRLLVAVIYTIVPGLDPDPDGYGLLAVQWSANGLWGTFEYFTTGAYMYSWLISLLYAVTGESEFAVRTLNVLLGVLLVWCSYKLTLEIWGSKSIALRSAWLVALFPNLIRFSASFPSREALLSLAFVIAIFFFIVWIKRGRFFYLLGSLLSFIISISLHTGMLGGLLAAGLIVMVMVCRHLLRNRARSLARAVVAALAISLSIALIWISGWGLEKVGKELTLSVGIERIRDLGEESAIGRAAYLQDAKVDNVTDAVWILPQRAGYFLFAPTIWMVQTSIDLLGVIDGLFYVVLAWCLILSRKYIWGNVLARYLLVIALVVITIFAMATSNYGTAIRHRAKIAPILISLIVITPITRYRRNDLRYSRVNYGNSTQG